MPKRLRCFDPISTSQMANHVYDFQVSFVDEELRANTFSPRFKYYT